MKRLLLLTVLLLATSFGASYGDIWTTRSSIPRPISALIAGTIDGKIYAGQGASGSPSTQGEFFVYDPVSNTWQTLPMPSGDTYSRVGGIINGKMYACGGVEHGGPLSKTEVYDPVANTWSSLQNMPTPRAGAGGTVANGKIYVSGGSAQFGANLGTLAHEVYDPSTNTWTQLANMPRPHLGHAEVAIGDKIYILAGVDNSLNNNYLSMIDVYDIPTDTWSTLTAQIPRVRVSCSAEVLNGKIYLFGGGAPGGVKVAEVDVFDPVSETWAESLAMPTPRVGLITTVLDGNVYTIAGENSSGYSSVVEVFTPTLSTTSDLNLYAAMANKLLVIDPTTFEIEQTIEKPIDAPYAWFKEPTLGPDGKTLYCITGLPGGVVIFDTEINTFGRWYPISINQDRLHQVRVTLDQSTMFVVNQDGAIPVVDLDTGNIITQISVPTQNFGSAISPDGTRFYEPHRDANSVSVIDTDSKSVIASINTASGAHQIALTSDGTRGYVVNEFAGSVSQVNLENNTLINTISVGSKPQSILVSPDDQQVYVALEHGNAVSVIDRATFTVSENIPIPAIGNDTGGMPKSLAVYNDYLFVALTKTPSDKNAIVVYDISSSPAQVESIIDVNNVGLGLSSLVLSQSQSAVVVSSPDTTSTYANTINVPIQISGVSGRTIVAAEVNVTYNSRIVTSAATEITNTLVELGWSIEENVLPGSGNIDTLAIAMSTAQDTIKTDGDLIYLTLQTADIRYPDSTALQLVHVLFNDGTPIATSIDGSLKLIGTDGVVDAQPDSIYPRNTIDITVTDIDLDLDVNTPDQVTITATGSTYSDTETVNLTEMGNSTGIFTGSVSTAYSASAIASGDGVIATIAGDSIIASYTDALSAAGNTVQRNDKVTVVGGTDAQLAASYVIQALDGRDNLRDIVRIRVTDLDPDLNVNTADQVSITTTNNALTESETLALPETDLITGIFQDSLLTQAGSSGTNNDGTVTLPTTGSELDSLVTVYIDTLNAAGGYDTLRVKTYVINMFGDVSADDRVGAFDAAQILAAAVSLRPLTFRDSLAADVDGSGEVIAIDASEVLQYVVRIIDTFAVQTDTVFNPPTDIKNHPFLKPAPFGQLIALGDLQSQEDGTYLLPIHLTERENIRSATLTLGSDPSIELLGVTAGNGYDKFMTAYNTTDEGIKIALAGSHSDLTGSGDVLFLKLRSTTDTPVRLSLDRVYLNGQLLTPVVNIESIEMVEAQAQNPLITQLHQNVPNPFNPQTTIRYDLAQSAQVNVVIYSVTGQRIRTLVSEHQDAGSYQISWDGKDAFGHDVGSSIYLVRMVSGAFIQTRKIVLLR